MVNLLPRSQHGVHFFRAFACVLALALSYTAFLPLANAQEITSSDTALSIPFPIKPTEGTLVCVTQNGYKPCDAGYDATMYGVATLNPASAIGETSTEDRALVVTRGRVLVRVTAKNGDIAAGDAITSSDTAGVGQKAIRNGYILGRALEEYKPQNKDEEGTILMSISITAITSFSDARSNLLEMIRQALESPTLTPLASLRYLLAFIIAIIAFTLGFVYFGRVTKAGIEAIGRNPLASKTIGASIVLQIVLNIVILIVGLMLAYIILVV